MPAFPVADGAANLYLDQRRSILLRWWLLLAAAIAVSSAPTLLGLALPLPPMLAVLAALAGFNAWLQWRSPQASVPAGELFGQLCVDLAALTVLLYLSGGAANPLISLLLIPVAVAALSLPGRLTALVTVLAVLAYSLLTGFYLPLAIDDVARAARLHLAGMWLTFVVSAAMIAWFVARMTASIRERDRDLAAAREQALRDERVVALGALAAGAAHELGTPLATIAVLVGELEREPSLDGEARADLALVREQVALCKGIIGGMAARSGATRAAETPPQDAAAWLRAVLGRWQAMRPRASAAIHAAGDGAVPLVLADPALEQAVANLLNNAADADVGEIRIELDWDSAWLRIAIRDRGPGFSAEVLRRGGRETLAGARGGAGIGLLLAFSAVERAGGRIGLDNPPGGGARVRIE
ncbi:MAG: HAMP domain-containing histidine kinase, partial [Sterolibacteriaceae bacterium]|nr:HAMP domain-containing histidine kinase [Sterolibacteriaceae bacterium]